MKYELGLYVDSGFHTDSEEISAYVEKVVKCRKPHICSHCQKQIDVSEFAVRESGFMEGEPVSAYTCINCIEEWLEESGQVEEE